MATNNGLPAEEERQRRNLIEQEIQTLQNTPNMTLEQQLRLQALQMRQQVLHLEDRRNEPNDFLNQIQMQNAQLQQQLQRVVPNNRARRRPRRAAAPLHNRTTTNRIATTGDGMIKLTLRGEDAEWDEDTDLVGSKCLCCWTNQANVAGTCCGKLMICIACTKTLYEGKLISADTKCLSCQASIKHCLRILF